MLKWPGTEGIAAKSASDHTLDIKPISNDIINDIYDSQSTVIDSLYFDIDEPEISDFGDTNKVDNFDSQMNTSSLEFGASLLIQSTNNISIIPDFQEHVHKELEPIETN